MRPFAGFSKALVLTIALSGCSGPETASTPTSAPPTSAATDEWLGQWNGPEGTFLRLEGGKGSYAVTIQDLDGPKTFQGSANGAQIQFDRNGARETIRATNGAETGMKWLADKHDCLTIRAGEGFCRD